MNLGPLDKRDLSLVERMNVLNGRTRIGWEDRQRYRDHLIEMYTKGHLTEDEYDARLEYVDLAKTQWELEFGFTDLPRTPLTPQPEPGRSKTESVFYFTCRSPWYTGIIAAIEWVLFLVGCVLGAPVTMVIGGVFGVMWTALTIKRYNNQKRNR